MNCGIRAAVALGVAVLSHEAAADTITGTIQSLQVNVQSNLAHVRFVGAPSFNGGSCAGPWTANSLDEDKFMRHIWPLLVAAKAAGLRINVAVSGCNGIYPKIFAVETEPST